MRRERTGDMPAAVKELERIESIASRLDEALDGKRRMRPSDVRRETANQRWGEERFECLSHVRCLQLATTASPDIDRSIQPAGAV